MRKYMAVLLLSLLAAVLFAGCQSGEQSGTTAPDATAPATTAPAETAEVTEAVETAEATEPTQIPEATEYIGVVVSTKYGNLYYQDQWADFMRVIQTEEDTGIIVSFGAEFNGVRYELFHLSIGEFGGNPVGQITDAQGVVHKVYAEAEELGIYPELTETEQNRLFAMQEDINFVLENLK